MVMIGRSFRLLALANKALRIQEPLLKEPQALWVKISSCDASIKWCIVGPGW
jgi:hypothetical protein